MGEEAFLVMWPRRLSALNPPLWVSEVKRLQCHKVTQCFIGKSVLTRLWTALSAWNLVRISLMYDNWHILENIRSNRQYAWCWHSLHDVPDRTVAVDEHQFVRHGLLVNEGAQVVAKECVWNPCVHPGEAYTFLFGGKAAKGKAWIRPLLPQIER